MSIKYVRIKEKVIKSITDKFESMQPSYRSARPFIVGFAIFILVLAFFSNRKTPIQTQQEDPSIFSSWAKNPNQCSAKPKDELLAGTQIPELVKLRGYQKLCDSFVSDSMMAFSIFPISEDELQNTAAGLGDTINQFSLLDIRPILLIEPINTTEKLNLKQIAEGKYDDKLETLFNALQETRNTDNPVLWVPYPEINTPTWDRDGFQESDYSQMINRFNRILADNFPQDRIGVLFNSENHPVWDNDWSAGEYSSFDPYLEGLDKGAVDVLIVQGFPWLPPASQEQAAKVLDPQEFLVPRYIRSAADKLGIEKVWINTGTFRAIHLDVPGETVTQTIEQRKKILDKVVDIAADLRKNDLEVTVHLFAQDKATEKEATDWSYTKTNEELLMLKDFITQLYSEKVNFAIYDK